MVKRFKEYTLLDILPEGPYTNEFDFKGTYTDADGVSHNVTVFDTEYFIHNVTTLFSGRLIRLSELKSSALTDFYTLFSEWASSRANLYFKQAYAYTLAYNPIENYSSRENMHDNFTTHEHGLKTTRSYTNFKEKDDYHNTDTTTDTNEVTTSPEDTNTEEKMAFNSAAYSGDRKTVRGGTITEKHNASGSGKDPGNLETQHTGYVEHTTSGSYDDTNSGTDTDRHGYILEKNGNIGVMTPAEMLQKEYDALSQDLAFRALCEFIDRYTYYCDSLEGWW